MTRSLLAVSVGLLIILQGCGPESEPLTVPTNSVLATDNIRDTTPGTFAGDFEVRSDGSAKYSIDLWTAPGRSGIQPNLSLEYNSRYGNGMLGMGWRLQGLSSIYRSNLFPALDGFPGPINYNDSDGLSLDGSRLILTRGKLGQDLSEYRTEQDRFVKVILHSPDDEGAGWFEARQKNGQIWKYGSTIDSRFETKKVAVFAAVNEGRFIYNPPNRVDQSFSIRGAWQLSAVEDRAGNCMTIRWQTFTSGPSPSGFASQILPLEINYTSLDDNGENFPANRHVRFFYDDRPDNSFRFSAGLKTALLKRLGRIEVWGPDGRSNSLLRSYSFNYQNTSITKRSQLISVTQADGKGIKMAPMTFQWEQGTTAFEKINTEINDLNSSTDDRWIECLDMNGDGLDDLLYIPADPRHEGASRIYAVRLSNGSGFGKLRNLGVGAPQSGKRPIAIDINGDSRKDLLTFVDGFFGPSYTDVPCFFQTEYQNGDLNDLVLGLQKAIRDKLAIAADVNGDGLSDIVAYNENDPGSWEYYLNQNGNYPIWPVPFTGPSDVVPTLYQAGRHEINMPDMDGDGAAELVGSANNSDDRRTAYELGRSPRIPSDRSYLSTLPAGAFSPFLDVNGDGLSDQVEPGLTPLILINVGKWHTDPLKTTAGVVYLPGGLPYDSGLRIFDYNSDGQMDLLVRLMNPIPPGTDLSTYPVSALSPIDKPLVLESTGSDFIPLDPAISGLPIDVPSIGLVQPLDVDGNGLDDLLIYDGTALQLFKRQGVLPDVMNAVVNGFGARIEMTYKNIADPAVYQKGSEATYPAKSLVAKTWVVSEYRETDGIGGMRHFELTYSDGRSDMHGRGFLGFSKVELKDKESRTHNFREYNLSATGSYYPLVGLPVRDSTVYQLDNGKIFTKCTSIEFETHEDWAAGFYFSFPKNVTETEREGIPSSLALIKTINTNQKSDEFGNITKYSQTTGDGEKYTVTAYFENDPNDWQVQRLIKFTESSIPRNGYGHTRTTGYEYDSKGFLARKIIEPGARVSGIFQPLPQPQSDGVHTSFVSYARRGDGQISQVVEGDPDNKPDWRTHSFRYDLADAVFLSAYQDPEGMWARIKFHPGFGVPVIYNSPNNINQEFQYDGFARVRSNHSRGAMGFQQNYRFVPGSFVNGHGFLQLDTKKDDGAEFLNDENVIGLVTTSHEYSGLHGQEVLTSNEYDQFSRLKKSSRKHFATDLNPAFTTYSYDNLNRVLSQSNPDHTGLRQSFTGKSILVSTGSGRRRLVYQSESGVTDSTIEFFPAKPGESPVPVKTSYEYGAFRNLQKVTDAAVKTPFYQAYDRLGRIIGYGDNDIGRKKIGYNVFGEVETVAIDKKPGIEVSTYKYDKDSRLQSVDNKDGKTLYIWDLATNGIGSLSKTVSPDGVTTNYGYNAYGNLNHADWTVKGSTYAIDYVIDAFGRMREVGYPAIGTGKPFKVRYNYGARGALTKVSVAGADLWTGLGTDEAGLPTNASGEFPQIRQGDNSTTRYHESSTLPGKLLSIKVTMPDGTGIGDLSYVYNPDGDLRERLDAVDNFNEAFTYDIQNRLTDWEVRGQWNHTEQFDYDQLNNLTNQTIGTVASENILYSYGGSAGAHAVTKKGGSAYGYDYKGNQVSGPGRKLTYTAFDLPKIFQTGSDLITFSYDAMQNRVLKEVGTSKSEITLNNLYERRQEGTRVEHRFNIYAKDEVIAQMVSVEDGGALKSEKVYFIHDNEAKSINLVTSQTGTVVDRIQYHPWGGRINSNGSNYSSVSGVRQGYTGHLHEDDLALINMKGRMYDPGTMHFLTPDPLVNDKNDGSSYNRYQYAYNNPLKWVDPSGLQATDYPDDDWSNINWTAPDFGFDYNNMVSLPPESKGKTAIVTTDASIRYSTRDYPGLRLPDFSRYDYFKPLPADAYQWRKPDWGWFGFGGVKKEIPIPFTKWKSDLEGLIVLNYDSKRGWSLGVIFVGGIPDTPLSGGWEKTWNFSGHQPDPGDFLLFGELRKTEGGWLPGGGMIADEHGNLGGYLDWKFWKLGNAGTGAYFDPSTLLEVKHAPALGPAP